MVVPVQRFVTVYPASKALSLVLAVCFYEQVYMKFLFFLSFFSILGFCGPFEPGFEVKSAEALSVGGSSSLSASLDDGKGKRRVWMNRHLVQVKVEGLVTFTTETYVFQGGWGAREYIYTFPLPGGSVITGLELEKHGQKTGRRGRGGPTLKGWFFDARFARRPIESTRGLPKRPDPGWLEWVGKDRYRLRLLPEKPSGAVKVRLRYVHMVSHEMGRRVYEYPRLGDDRRLVNGLLVLKERLRPYSGAFVERKHTLDAKKSLKLPLKKAPAFRSPLTVEMWLGRGTGRGGEKKAGLGKEKVAEKDLKKQDHVNGGEVGSKNEVDPFEGGASNVALLSVLGNHTKGRAAPTHVIFAVDVSRSMWKGSRLHAWKLMKAMAGELKSSSRFGVQVFSREPEGLFERPVSFSRGAMQRARRWVLSYPHKNGTDVVKVLKTSIDALEKAPKGVRKLVVLFTDGLVGEEDLSKQLSEYGEGVELAILMGTRATESVWSLHGGSLSDLADVRGAAAYGFDPFKLDKGSQVSRKGGATGAGGAGRTSTKSNATGKRGSKSSGEKNAYGWPELAALVTSPGRVSKLEISVDNERLELPRNLQQFSTGSAFFRMFRIENKNPRRAHVRYNYRGKWHRHEVKMTRLKSSEGSAALSALMARAEIQKIGRGLVKKYASAIEASGRRSHDTGGSKTHKNGEGEVERGEGDEGSIAARTKKAMASIGKKRRRRSSDEDDKEMRFLLNRSSAREAFRRARASALRAKIVSWATSLIVLDMKNEFARDRYRFADRWGHRFFRRLAYKDAPRFRVNPPWVEHVREKVPVEIVSTGKLTKGVVLRVIRTSYLKRAKACYQERVGLGATSNRLTKGRVLLEMDFTRGEVARVELKNSELKDLKLERCLIDGAYKLKIPRSRRDRTLYRVVYPLRFRPDKQSVEILKNADYTPSIQVSDDPLHGLE